MGQILHGSARKQRLKIAVALARRLDEMLLIDFRLGTRWVDLERDRAQVPE